MKGFFKRFKLSEWLIICQLISSIVALILSMTNNFIADAFGLVWNIVNAIAILIVFFRSNARNYKSYEVTGQFIFSKLSNSFSSFMDFLMSDEYKPDSFEEQALLQDRLFAIAKNGDYEDRRKISRALPYLYDIDKRMTHEIAKVLRDDMVNGSTDIRRRTVESLLSIIQRADGARRQKRLYRKYKPLFAYLPSDDSFTIVACIESYFYCYAFLASTAREKAKVLAGFSALKDQARCACEAGVGKIEESFIRDMDTIWETLSQLYQIGHAEMAEYAEAMRWIDGILESGGKFPKLAVVKNLYYTCGSFPGCLAGKTCTSHTSGYMLTKVNDFLTTAMEGDVFLSMPAVRYFDCVCSNIRQRESRKLSQKIIRNYYVHDDMLINQTAFDKFDRLAAEDPEFGKEALAELLQNNVEHLDAEARTLARRISDLPEDKRGAFSVSPGRTKIKRLHCGTCRERMEREADPDIRTIDGLLEKHYERIRFVGKIKQIQEEISR